jgi:hypothetical protein
MMLVGMGCAMAIGMVSMRKGRTMAVGMMLVGMGMAIGMVFMREGCTARSVELMGRSMLFMGPI